jgi:hypothetical protein
MMVHSPSYLEVILFSLVRYLLKKITKIELFFFEKKNRNRTKTGSNRPVLVWLFWDKNRFKPVWLGFFQFGSVFFGLGSIRFFQFQVYKIETEPVGFFKF